MKNIVYIAVHLTLVINFLLIANSGTSILLVKIIALIAALVHATIAGLLIAKELDARFPKLPPPAI